MTCEIRLRILAHRESRSGGSGVSQLRGEAASLRLLLNNLVVVVVCHLKVHVQSYLLRLHVVHLGLQVCWLPVQ